MKFGSRTAVLAAVLALPLGAVLGSYALADDPAVPDLPAEVRIGGVGDGGRIDGGADGSAGIPGEPNAGRVPDPAQPTPEPTVAPAPPDPAPPQVAPPKQHTQVVPPPPPVGDDDDDDRGDDDDDGGDDGDDDD